MMKKPMTESEARLVMFDTDEKCPECGGLHFSRFRHQGDRMREQIDKMWGGGDKQNVAENALAEAFLAGYRVAKEKTS